MASALETPPRRGGREGLIMEKIKVLLVDDRDVIRDCLKLLFKSSLDIEIVAEANDGLEALYKAQNCEYDIILMDYNMPEKNGLVVLKNLMEINPNIRVLMFSMVTNADIIRELLDEGAYGYIVKNSHINIYEQAIKIVNSGGKYLCEETKNILTQVSDTAS